MNMKLSEALATVLNIQLAQVGQQQHYVRGLHDLGDVQNTTIDQAIYKAVCAADYDEVCPFAIFPIGSDRGNYYMEIERELLRQEAAPEMEGKKMWEHMGEDPRQLVNNTMVQFRDCAVAVVVPTSFRRAWLRTACLLIAGLQWIDDWYLRLQVRRNYLAGLQEPPKALPATEAAALHKLHPFPSEGPEPVCSRCRSLIADCKCDTERKDESDVYEKVKGAPVFVCAKCKEEFETKHELKKGICDKCLESERKD